MQFTSGLKSSHIFFPLSLLVLHFYWLFFKRSTVKRSKVKSLRIPSTEAKQGYFHSGRVWARLVVQRRSRAAARGRKSLSSSDKSVFGVKFSCQLQAWQLRDGGKHRYHALETDDDDDDVQSSSCRLACTWCSGEGGVCLSSGGNKQESRGFLLRCHHCFLSQWHRL